MSFRSKTKRRLILLVGFCLLVAAGAFWMLRGPNSRASAAKAELWRDGMAEYGRGDYLAAMPKLSQYLSDAKISQKDPSEQELDALFAFGDCRRRIPMPRQQHLREADQAFERYLSYRPTDANAQLVHLKVLSRTPQFREAQALAERVLERDPKHVEALFTRAYSMYRMPKPRLDEVELALENLLKVDPGHVNGLLLSQQIQLQRGASPKQLIERIEPLAQADDKDPRFELVAAETYHMLALSDAGKTDPASRAQWENRGREWLMKVLEQPTVDAEFAIMVASSLDRVLLVNRSLKYLMTAREAVKADDESRDRLNETLVRRLWQNNIHSEVVRLTEGLDPANTQSDADLLAYRAITLTAQAASPSAGDARTRLLNEAEAIGRALQARTASPEAQAWAILLKLDTGEPRPAAEEIKRCLEAREKNPENAVVAARLGDAYWQSGETEAAVQMWTTAARLTSDWGYPYARIALLRFEESRFDEAERLADRARLLSPTNRQFLALLAQARYAALPKNASKDALAAQLSDIEKVQSAYPNESGTLPLQVTLLARVRGADAARQRLTQALAVQPPLPVDTLLRLLAINDTEKLGMDSQLQAAVGDRDGARLPVAVQAARKLLAAGKADEGLASLLESQKKAGGQADPKWMLAIASYRDEASNADAVAAWNELAKKVPDDLYVQTQVLKSPTRFKDRSLWKNAIDRVKVLSGDDGALWKLEQARFLLAAPDAASNQTAEAIALLTELSQRNRDSAEARRLLGLALRRDGKHTRAAEELSGALQMAPSRGDIGLELIDTLRLAGDLPAARTRIKEVAAIPTLTPAQRMRLATYFQDLGLEDDAIKTLSALSEGGERDARLGALYRAVGQVDQAKSAFNRVLNDINAAPEDIFAGADFFAALGDRKQAQYFLDRLQTMPQSRATTEMLLGQFKERYAQADEALVHLTKATEAEPKNPLAWKALAGFSLRSRRYDDAVSAVDAGLAVAPTDSDLLALKPLIGTVRKLVDVEPVRLLVDYLSRQPNNAAASATLDVLAKGQAAAAAAPAEMKRDVMLQTMEQLVALAEQHREFWTLQERVILYHLAQNKPEKAAELADRATAYAPALAEPPRLASEAYARMGRWDRVVQTATIWRQRAWTDPMPADLMIAGAMLAQQQPAGAIRTLDPHIAARPLPESVSADKPLDSRLLILHQTYARALIEQGRLSEAADRLAPLIKLGEAGRTAWLSLTATIFNEADAMQWIDKATAGFPQPPSAVDRLSLAEACIAAGRPSGSAALLDRGLQAVEPLTSGDKPLPEALRLAALLSHFKGDHLKSEQYWRSLQKQTDTADVRNNLAYILLASARNEVVGEAKQLAEAAVKAEPRNAVYLGTLARAYARSGDKDQAVATYRQVLSIDPDSVEALLGLADELSRRTPAERTEARKLVAESRRLMQQKPQTADPDLKRQAEQLQAGLDAR